MASALPTPVLSKRRTLGSALLGALLAALALAPGAGASVSWLVEGHGIGHGVGMSQYGAYGYAEHGKGYRFILGHYYQGTSIGTLAGPEVVRVLLGVVGGDIGFSEATSACGVTLDADREYRAHRVGSAVELRTGGGELLASCGRRLRAAGNGRVQIAGIGAYRGALEVVPTDSDVGSLNAIDAVGVDQYVKGVIANEVSPSWPQAALRAQAIASRSFALSVQVEGNGFDLYSDPTSQAYKGIASETAATNRAVEATSGEVVTYQGQVAQTYYFACSGGHTESVQDVFFGAAIPYLVGVADPYDYYCPLHRWSLHFTGPEISAKLAPYLDGKLKRIVVIQHGTSPRILWARLYGTDGTTKIRGDQLASALGAYGPWMTFRKLVDGRLVDTGESESAGGGGAASGGGEAGAGGTSAGASGGTGPGDMVD
jgi:stage II sporulation protein D